MAGGRYSPMRTSSDATSELDGIDDAEVGAAASVDESLEAHGGFGLGSTWRALAGLSLLGVALTAILILSNASEQAVLRLRSSARFQDLAQAGCTENQVGVDFMTRAALPAIHNVPSAEVCRTQCLAASTDGCAAWTWGEASAAAGLAKVCFLKKLEQGEKPIAAPTDGVVSGLACSVALPRSSASAPDCRVHQNVDYWTKTSLRTVSGIWSAKACSATCASATDCGAWTWVRSQQNCFLKQLQAEEEPTQVPKLGATSGRACALQNILEEVPTPAPSFSGEGTVMSGSVFTPIGQSEEPTVQEVTAAPTTTARVAASTGTLWCFALMQPFGYEPRLLEKQMKYGQSIFGCDGYDVYSNRSWMFGNGHYARIVDINLKCEIGGEFKTALNAGIFKAVWLQVVNDGTYQFYDWTVKADPDCVFFPDRLRTLLQGHNALANSNGVYLNNCRFGMHGPLEVFSKAAVVRLVDGWEECEAGFRIKCSGDCRWGEDMFIDQCLSKVLNAKREDEYNLLTEDHCDPPDNWDDCSDTSKAAFHPFKQWDLYKQCVLRASSGSDTMKLVVDGDEGLDGEERTGVVDGATTEVDGATLMDSGREGDVYGSGASSGAEYEEVPAESKEYFK